jgi:hypothetical protein
MGVGYTLANQTKKEKVSFLHIPAKTARELAGNSVSAAMVAWYMLENRGDNIAFVSDTYDDWPFPGDYRQLSEYIEMTDKVVDSLIDAEILVDVRVHNIVNNLISKKAQDIVNCCSLLTDLYVLNHAFSESERAWTRNKSIDCAERRSECICEAVHQERFWQKFIGVAPG